MNEIIYPLCDNQVANEIGPFVNCSIIRHLWAAVVARLVTERSWVQIFRVLGFVLFSFFLCISLYPSVVSP